MCAHVYVPIAQATCTCVCVWIVAVSLVIPLLSTWGKYNNYTIHAQETDLCVSIIMCILYLWLQVGPDCKVIELRQSELDKANEDEKHYPPNFEVYV